MWGHGEGWFRGKRKYKIVNIFVNINLVFKIFYITKKVYFLMFYNLCFITFFKKTKDNGDIYDSTFLLFSKLEVCGYPKTRIGFGSVRISESEPKKFLVSENSDRISDDFGYPNLSETIFDIRMLSELILCWLIYFYVQFSTVGLNKIKMLSLFYSLRCKDRL